MSITVVTSHSWFSAEEADHFPVFVDLLFSWFLCIVISILLLTLFPYEVTGGPWATLFLVLVKVRAAQNSCTSKQFSLTKVRVEQNNISWYSSQIYIYRIRIISMELRLLMKLKSPSKCVWLTNWMV